MRIRIARTRLVVLASLRAPTFLKRRSGSIVLFVPSQGHRFRDHRGRFVLFGGQYSSANVTVGIGAGRKVTIDLLYHL